LIAKKRSETGYLVNSGKGAVDPQSLTFFAEKYAGTEKLNGRANKSLKDSHNHIDLTKQFLGKIVSQEKHLGSLGDSYQQSLSESYRNKEGVYYTPEHIVSDMFRPPREDVSTSVFCDPCCGSGNFIIRAIEIGFSPGNIIGFDTDPVAVELTKTRIRALTGYDCTTIHNKDFLKQSISTHAAYDYIFTNPPWGKKLPKETKQSYAAVFKAGKSSDTCSLFFFACLKTLKEGGHLGFLLPEAFFNIATYEDARRAALALNVERLIDYNKPFAGLVTRAQALILRAQPNPETELSVCCEANNAKHKRTQASFSINPKSILNFACTADSSAVIDHVFDRPHATLAGNAQWGLGIVTGNNKKWIRSTTGADYVPVFKGSDIQSGTLKKPTCFIPSDFSLYQQVAPIELYNAPEKLIYKFISSDLAFFADSEQRYILNSANMLIPESDFPISCNQLADLLNSDFMNWLFKNIFNTHKILRGDLETLPIHVDFFDYHPHFAEHEYLDHLGIRKEENGTYRLKEEDRCGIYTAGGRDCKSRIFKVRVGSIPSAPTIYSRKGCIV
jgi:site-specific DNA-methyltransferase (adenine-specific)